MDSLEEDYQEFFQLILDLIVLGEQKYSVDSFQTKIIRGDITRTERLSAEVLEDHSATHYDEYQRGVLHDHFHDLQHQLAAVAVNPLIEYILAKREGRFNSAMKK